jgi:hypothetical protein
LGKPRKIRHHDGTVVREVSPASSNGILGPKADAILHTTTYTSESSPEPTDSFLFGPGTPKSNYQDAFMTNGFEDGRSSNYSNNPSSLLYGWPSRSHVDFPNSVDMFAPWPQYLQPSAPYAGHVRSTSVQSQPEMFVPLESIQSPPIENSEFFGLPDSTFAPQDKMMESPSPTMSGPLPTPPAPETQRNHNCTRFAFQTLNSLYAPPESQPSAGDIKGTLGGLPTLDSVLSTNKAAVDKLHILLDCACSTNPLFSTTITFTIVKILSWYQAVAGMNLQDPRSPLQTRMEAFTYAPVSLGAFRPEHDDTFRTNLVLSELRRIEKLIDRFAERYCKTANPAETGIEGGVYGALETLLRTRVRDTFKIIMRTAPENIKRQLAASGHSRARVHTL